MSAEGFARFAARVAADGALAARLRPIDEAGALVAAAAAEARALGFDVAAPDVEAAMRNNRVGWLMHPSPLIALPARPGEGTGAVAPARGGLLDGWTPFRAAPLGDGLAVDWCHLGPRRFTAPFSFETISLGIGHPFNAAFQQRRSADELAALSRGLRPSGFVFHAARCGSTLVAQALAADPAHIVMSEPTPVRNALEAARAAPPARGDAWLKGMIDALGRPRFPGESRFFVKFMAADVLDIARVTRVFPDVPWIFLTRDPLEILASQMRSGGADTIRGAVPAERLGLRADEVWTLPAQHIQLHALAAYARAALDALARPGSRGLVLDHRDLPEALWGRIPAHFGFAPGPAGLAAMRAVARHDAKAPGTPFVPDGDAKRKLAAPWREAAERIAGDGFAALDAARRGAA